MTIQLFYRNKDGQKIVDSISFTKANTLKFLQDIKAHAQKREATMNIIEIEERTATLIQQLLEIWEASVKATHHFLSIDEISMIKEYVPMAIQEIPHLIVAVNEQQIPIAFMGVAGQTLEMLFVFAKERGQGYGKALLEYGMKTYAVNKLMVNEQNPSAKGFYEHMGFTVYKRSDMGEQGNPYPLLYMKLDA